MKSPFAIALDACARPSLLSALLSLALALTSAPPPAATPPAPPTSQPTWTKLPTEPYRGKQDDIHFISPSTGWYVNGAGKIFSTTDGGATWLQRIHKPGTFFRCIGFLDEKVGFAGNIGPDYFPNVSDATPLYRTDDGGTTWSPVTIVGDPVKGLCAIEIVKIPFINAGNLDHKTLIVAAGRVGGPTTLLFSHDRGATWAAKNMDAHCGMILDVHFFNEKVGLLAAASSTNVQESNALLLRTEDGGATWTKVYQSTRPFETTWKMSFPTPTTGYVTLQSYNPDPTASQRFLAKTTDGGKTFTEIPLIDQHTVRQFGIAFLDENTGWVGAMPHGFVTTDGGKTWSKTNFGNAVNKIRVLKSDDGSAVAYAIGVDVYKLIIPSPAPR